MQFISSYLKDKKVIRNKQPELFSCKPCLINTITSRLAGNDKSRGLGGGLNCRALIQREVEKLED